MSRKITIHKILCINCFNLFNRTYKEAGKVFCSPQCDTEHGEKIRKYKVSDQVEVAICADKMDMVL